MVKGVCKHEKTFTKKLIYPLSGVQVSQANIK